MKMALQGNLTSELEEALTQALGGYLDSWRNNSTQVQKALSDRLTQENFKDVILYVIVVLGMLAFVIVAILASTVRSKRREHSDDPYHTYIEDDWTARLKNQSVAELYVHANPMCQLRDEPCSP